MSKLISFSYIPFPIIDDKSGNVIGECFRPIITIRLSLNYGQLTRPFDALADSGSDKNLFPAHLGEVLKIDFKKIIPKIICGIGGIEIKAYPAKLYIWVNNVKYQTEADFSYEQNQPLLGRNGFFNLFKSVSFKEADKFTELVSY